MQRRRPGQSPDDEEGGGDVREHGAPARSGGLADLTDGWARDVAGSMDLEASVDFLREMVEVARRRRLVLWELVALGDLIPLLERRGGSGDADEAAHLAATVRSHLRSAPHVQTAPMRVARLSRRGATWSVACGTEETTVNNVKGMHYLAQLVLRPGLEILAVDMATGGQSLTSLGLDPVDAAAAVAYRRRIAELRERLADSERDDDIPGIRSIQDELDAVVAELAASLGLYGRARQSGSPSERARQSVTKALRSVVRHLHDGTPRLAAHLEVSLRTGTYCSYRPDPAAQVTWVVD